MFGQLACASPSSSVVGTVDGLISSLDAPPRGVRPAEVWSSLTGGALRAARFLQGDGVLVAELVTTPSRSTRGLGLLEHSALELAVATHSYKMMSSALGTTFWGARDATLRALQALGLPTRAHAVWVGAALREELGAGVTLTVAPRAASVSPQGGARVTLEVAPRGDLPLTPAEWHIAFGLARGLCNKEIAARRRASTRTVANQIRTLGEKLRAHGRLEIVRALLG